MAAATRRMVSPKRTASAQDIVAVRVATSLVARAASGAARQRRSASARASSMTWSPGTTFQARPISLARSASMGSPVRRSSMASAQATFRGMRMAPTMVGMPMVTSGQEKVAWSAAMTKSQATAAVSP